MSSRPIRISVIGAYAAPESECETAYAVGKLLAERGCVLITGGLGGVMEAASRGASEAGGTVIGFLPFLDESDANPHVTIPLPTGLGYARNLLVARTPHGVIAVGGRIGTLTEIAYALHSGRPVVGLGTWDLDEKRLGTTGIIAAATPGDAVSKILALTKKN
jgi:uncharacterized protein (TIGR00725 family)